MREADADAVASGFVYSFGEAVPAISATAFLAATAVVIGKVTIGEGSSVWFGAVLRGDACPIRIGRGTNIQDGAVIHGDDGGSVDIADDVTIGHGAIVHGCTIESGALIGMGAIILDGAVIGRGALVGAGAVVSRGVQVGAASLWLGCPARKVRDLSPDAEIQLRADAQYYRQEARHYRSGHLRRIAPAQHPISNKE